MFVPIDNIHAKFNKMRDLTKQRQSYSGNHEEPAINMHHPTHFAG